MGSRCTVDRRFASSDGSVLLADLSRGLLRKKIPALQAALEGRFDSEHALIVGRILAHIDYLEEAIEALSGAIEEQLGPRHVSRQRRVGRQAPLGQDTQGLQVARPTLVECAKTARG